jgi:hypothetical protein
MQIQSLRLSPTRGGNFFEYRMCIEYIILGDALVDSIPVSFATPTLTACPFERRLSPLVSKSLRSPLIGFVVDPAALTCCRNSTQRVQTGNRRGDCRCRSMPRVRSAHGARAHATVETTMHIDALLLSRFQFAWVIALHVLLPAFTVDLSCFIATLEILWWITCKDVYDRLSAF